MNFNGAQHNRLTADELANLIPAVERYAEVETEQFANLPNSSLTLKRAINFHQRT